MSPNDPGIWRVIADALEHFRISISQESIRPHVFAALLSFVIALLRALTAGGKFVKSLYEAVLCGALTLSVFPVLDYYGMNIYLAVSIGAGISFLGVDWFRGYIADAAARILDKWDNKQ